MKKYKKECVLCNQTKNKTEFPSTDRGRGKCEYCLNCKEKFKNHIFLFNNYNYVIDALTQEEANILILTEHIQFNKNKYIANDYKHYLEFIKNNINQLTIPNNHVLAIGKYNEKRNCFSKEKARRLVNEGAAVWEKEHQIRHLFSGKELQEYIVKRDNETCYYCNGKGDRITFLISRSKNGLLSPKNSICCCEKCKEKEGENFFFYKWLNIPVIVNKRNITNNNEIFSITEARHQTTFLIHKKHALQLIEEEMATLIDNNKIYIIYERQEFREFILKRDNYTCFYCEKTGDTIDHVVPKANGGMTTPKNCVCACESCNGKKSDLQKEDFLRKNSKF